MVVKLVGRLGDQSGRVGIVFWGRQRVRALGVIGMV